MMKKVLITILKIVIFFIGWALLTSFIPVPDFESPAIWRFSAELIPCLSILGMSLLFWFIEKKKVQIISYSDFFKNILVGLIGGIVWIGSAVLIMLVTGILETSDVNSVSMLWLWLFSVLINTVMQELLVRGYIYQLVKQKHNIIAAVVTSTALFTLMHGGIFEAGVIPVLNVVSMSLFMTVVLEYTHSLIAPIFMHFLWNGIGAVILGGVSLADDYPHLFNASFNGNALLSGGIYKIEGSIIVLLINIALAGGVIFLIKHKKKSYHNF